MGKMLKVMLTLVLRNKKLQKVVFLWLAQKLVDATENTLDDDFLKDVKEALE